MLSMHGFNFYNLFGFLFDFAFISFIIQFDAQDVLVPWHLQPRKLKNQGKSDCDKLNCS